MKTPIAFVKNTTVLFGMFLNAESTVGQLCPPYHSFPFTSLLALGSSPGPWKIEFLMEHYRHF